MKRIVSALTDETFDVVILGGGITGAGVALDAALRGWRVAVIDKGDFASGTSSVSSKLVHGGLRYLEQGQLPLVYEALQERGRLLRNAPHLVNPLRFVIPFYKHGRVPPWKWRLGLTLYDLLAGRANIHRSRPLTVRTLTRTCADLSHAGLEGGAEYYDAQMDDARLCLEVLQTAAVTGACVVNYVEAVGFERQHGRISAVRIVDRVTGHELTVRGRQVLNAAGPWVDAVARLAGEDGEPHLQPAKGVHVVVPHRAWPAALLLLHPADGRVFFVLPWMGKTLLGTTDTFTPIGPDELSVEAQDIAYLLDGFNHYLQPALTVKDVLGSFAGLRPLLRARQGEPSSRSREFRLWQGPSGLLSVAGGKYTTYRRMAEIITDRLGELLGKTERCRTRAWPLEGTPSEAWETFVPRTVTDLCQRFSLPCAAATHLVGRYGRHAEAAARYVADTPGGRDPLCAGEPDLRGELGYQRDHEMALFAADHLLRRMRLGLFQSVPANQLLPPASVAAFESTRQMSTSGS